MKAVIIPAVHPEKLSPFTDWAPIYLLPVVNKPVVEHLIELLVRHQIKNIIIVKNHMPFETEQYFGKGERWGVDIEYVLERDYTGFISSFHNIHLKSDEHILCMPGNIITDLDITGLINAHSSEKSDITMAVHTSGHTVARSTVINFKDLERNVPYVISSQGLLHLLSGKANTTLNVTKYVSPYNVQVMQSPADYQEANARVLRGEFKDILIPGKKTENGIWIGRQAKIHPSVRLTPPLLIGENCQIMRDSFAGNGSVIGNNVIIDENAQIENSVIWDNTYIGSHTEVANSIVRKNFLFNVSRLVNTYVKDDHIIGDIEMRTILPRFERTVNLTLAFFFLVASLPVSTVLFLYNVLCPSKRIFCAEPRFGSYEISDLSGNVKPKKFTLYFFRSRNRLIQKIPGLINVLRGDMNIVGNSPLTAAQANRLREEWESVRFQVPAGLFHIWEADLADNMTWNERFVAENYYAVTRSLKNDLFILMKSFFALLFNLSACEVIDDHMTG